jgi:type II secretory pathway component PulF
MTYPAVIAVIMGLVVTFIMSFMVPRFAQIFAGMGDELPWSTRLFLGAGELIHSRWWIAPPMILLVIVGWRWLWRREAVQNLWDRAKTRAPVIGALYTEACLFQLCSTFSLLLQSHVSPVEAVAIARTAIRNSEYDAFFDRLLRSLESGRGLAPAFQETAFLPDTVKLMVATGEAAGALDVVMGRLAERYQEDLESDIRRLSSLLEPLMLVVMGILVGFVAVSFILPIFKMSRALR